MSNIYLVLDDLSSWRAEFPADAVISFDTYLKEHPIKGEKKTEHNEYGLAAKEFLDKEKLTKEFVKANPEQAKKLIVEGLKKAAEKSSKDGKKFADKLKAGELPATDAGL